MRLGKLVDQLGRLANALAALALISLVLLILLEIAFRNAMIPTMGLGTEYSIYLFVFLVFVALAPTQKSGEMIYMEIFFDRTTPLLRSILDLLRWALGSAYGLLVSWEIWRFVGRTCELGQVSMFQSRTPLCGPQAAMTGGVMLLTLVFLFGTIAALTKIVSRKFAVNTPTSG